MTFKTLLSDINNVALAMESLKNVTQFNTGSTIANGEALSNVAIEQYKASIDGLNLSQAQAALSATALNDAQKQQILTSAGLLENTQAITLEEVKQMASSAALSTQKKEEILATLQGAYSEGQWNTERLEAIASGEGEAATIAQTILAKKAESAENVKNIAGRKALTASLKEELAARIALMASNPVTWIVGIAAVSVGLIALQEKFSKSLEECTEDLKNYNSEFEDSQSSVKSLESELDTCQTRLEELQKLADNGTLSIVEQEEYERLQKTNDELKRNLKIEREKAQLNAIDGAKTADETVNKKVQSNYVRGDVDSYEGVVLHDQLLNVTPKEELEGAIAEYNRLQGEIDKLNKSYDDGSISSEDYTAQLNGLTDAQTKARTRASKMSDILIECEHSYNNLENTGGKFTTTSQQNYDSVKLANQEYSNFLDTINDVNASFDKLDTGEKAQTLKNKYAQKTLQLENGQESHTVEDKEISDWIDGLSDDDLSVLATINFSGEQTKKSMQEALDYAKTHTDAASEETSISPTSFEDAWTALDSTDKDEIKTLKKDLLEVAEAGQLSAEKFSELDKTEYFKNLGISADSAIGKINGLVNASTQLSSMSTQISKMSDMLADKKNGTVASASDLAGFDVSVRGLESWDEFEEVMGSSESSMDQCQKAANTLATEWVNDGNFLANLTDENKQYYITQLEDMGVKNAEQIVTEALAKKEEELRFEKLLSADASTDLQNATVADILKLQNLGDITEQEKAKLAAFTLEKQYCNKNTIVTDADCQNIYTLAKMAGAGTEALNKLAALKQRLSDNPIMSNEMRNNINNAIQDIVNGVTTSAGAKLDIPQVKVNSSGSSSYKSPSSKKSKSKSKTKSDAAEVFDFIEIKLNNLTDKASKAKDKIDDLLTFGQKKNQTKKAIEATTKAITAQEKAYKKYMAYANKAAKTQNSKKTTSSSSTSTGGNAVYDTATDYLGLKYVWGGASLTKGADCSGFTQQIYKKFGVSLPHHAADQAKMGTKITSKKKLQAGDLVFFGSKNNITHVGIYGGDGKFIESPHTGASVRVSKLSSRKDFVSGSRFSGISGSTTTSGRNVKNVKGVSSKTLEHYKKLIREGTLDGTGIASIKNENLKNALKDYQTYYEKAKACKEQVASLTDQLKDLYETLANNPIDNASDKIEKLGTKMDILNAKVSNLTFDPTKKIGTSDIDGLYKQIIKNYDSQLSASKTAYTDATKSYNSNKSSLTKSLNKTKAKNIGLTQKEFNSIKSSLKSNKDISYNLVNKITNDSLREKCIAHNEYLLAKNTAADNYNQAKEDHTSNVRQTRKDRFDKVQARYDNKAGLIEQKKNAVSNSLSIAEAKGQLIGDAYYTRQADAVKSDMQLKQEEAEKLAKKLSTIKFGSDEWYEAQEALNGVYESIQQDEQELAEFQKSINQLKFDRFDELLNKLGDITDETDFLIDMLDSDNLFDSDTGMISQDGITAMGLTAQNYDTYLAKAQEYKDAIADLNEMYKNGKIGLDDYNSQLRTYQQGQRDSIKSANEAKKSLVSYVKQGLDAQNDALSDAIDKKKKLLETEKD